MVVNPRHSKKAQTAPTSGRRREEILAPKIYDRCVSQDCVTEGPAVSEEKHKCIILHPDLNGDPFGRLIWPGKPICLPKWVQTIRYVEGSFRVKRLSVSRIAPTPIQGYWEINTEFVFAFQLKLFGNQMAPIQILCCADHSDSPKHGHLLDALSCSVLYIKQTTLHGDIQNAAMIASDILPPQSYGAEGTPHALVQANVVPVSFKLKRARDLCGAPCPLDDVCYEPFHCISITAAVRTEISLFQLACLSIYACDCRQPEVCSQSGCDLFQKIAFPTDQFGLK